MHRPSQMPPRLPGTLRVRYRLGVTTRDEGEALARRIALEQTVELPESAIPPRLTDLVPGRLTSLEPSPGQGFTAFIEYPAWLAEGGLAQLLNLLFGNISLLDGVVVEDVDWPPSLLHRHPGPRYGMAGLRRLAGLVPAERLLVETDAPYLTPAPEKNRTRRNEPAFVKSVLLKLAEVRQADPEQLADTIWNNTCRLYGLSS